MLTNFLQMQSWDPNDPTRQITFIEDLKVQLQNISNEVISGTVRTIYVQSGTIPAQANWEAAWLAQTDLPLPILPSAQLVWMDTSGPTTVVGGIYGTTPLSTTAIRREPRYPKTGTNYYGVSSLSAAVASSTAVINTSNTNHPALTFTLAVKSTLLLRYLLYTRLSSGTGTWGGDFLLDGVKVGGSIFGLPANQGIMNLDASGQMDVEAMIPNVAAGLHTVQAIMGVTGSPASAPAISYGGITNGANQYGIRQLRVRAVTE